MTVEKPLESAKDLGTELTTSGSMLSVLLVDDEPGILRFLQKGLARSFGLIEVATDTAMAEELRQRCHFDLIIADIRLPGQSGVEWVTEIREQSSTTAVIFITAYADLDTALGALRAGASDMIIKPFRMEQVLTAADRCLEGQRMKRENFLLRRQVDNYFDDSGMVGNCDLMKNLCGMIKRVAPMPSTVLIEGESGTGKELAARALHKWSGRNGSFVPVNCGAMSAELLESELFGHVKGAYTGAHQAHEGLIAYANEGSLFLDEIGEMPMPMQTHLLRVLEERKVRPVGSNGLVPVNVRVIAATNRNLAEEVQKGNFREDLYYRLNVLSLCMPALRDRGEDIAPLAHFFSDSLSREMGVPVEPLSESECRLLEQYGWPGNVRELKNVIERGVLLGVPPSACISNQMMVTLGEVNGGINGVPLSLKLEEVERLHILKVLKQEAGNKTGASKILGVSRKTLERKVRAWEEAGLNSL